jgi:hypothetical protein
VHSPTQHMHAQLCSCTVHAGTRCIAVGCLVSAERDRTTVADLQTSCRPSKRALKEHARTTTTSMPVRVCCFLHGAQVHTCDITRSVMNSVTPRPLAKPTCLRSDARLQVSAHRTSSRTITSRDVMPLIASHPAPAVKTLHLVASAADGHARTPRVVVQMQCLKRRHVDKQRADALGAFTSNVVLPEVQH